jgi:hypothetical protein
MTGTIVLAIAIAALSIFAIAFGVILIRRSASPEGSFGGLRMTLGALIFGLGVAVAVLGVVPPGFVQAVHNKQESWYSAASLDPPDASVDSKTRRLVVSDPTTGERWMIYMEVDPTKIQNFVLPPKTDRTATTVWYVKDGRVSFKTDLRD